MDMEHIDWRNSLLTSLYSQVEFLKAEIKEKNEVNVKLLELIKSYQINQLNYVKSIVNQRTLVWKRRQTSNEYSIILLWLQSWCWTFCLCTGN